MYLGADRKIRPGARAEITGTQLIGVMTGMASVELIPLLTVKDARGIVEFYKKAFGATELSRQSTPTGQFIIEMAIDGERFFAVDENPSAFNVSPATLGGTSVRLSLIVADPDAVADRAVGRVERSSFRSGISPTGCGRAGSPIRRDTTGSSASRCA